MHLLPILLSLLGLASVCRGEVGALIPLLPTPPGHVLGGQPDARVHVEAFIEVLCPDSRNAWPHLVRITEEYAPEDVRVTIHQQVLPYHRNAFIATQGYYLVEALAPQAMEDYITIMFANIGMFSTSATRGQSENQVVANMAALQESVTGIEPEVFSSSINNAAYITHTRDIWKYAVRRGIAGTPWYAINGIELNADPNGEVDFESWKATLDRLLGIGNAPEETVQSEVHNAVGSIENTPEKVQQGDSSSNDAPEEAEQSQGLPLQALPPAHHYKAPLHTQEKVNGQKAKKGIASILAQNFRNMRGKK